MECVIRSTNRKMVSVRHKEEKMNNSWFHRSLIAVASLVAISLMLVAPAPVHGAPPGCKTGECAVYVCGQEMAFGACDTDGGGCACWDYGSDLPWDDGSICYPIIN